MLSIKFQLCGGLGGTIKTMRPKYISLMLHCPCMTLYIVSQNVKLIRINK